MRIHQPPKAHPQRTICSYESLLCSNMKNYYCSIYHFSFLRIICLFFPLSALLRMGFSQNENITPLFFKLKESTSETRKNGFYFTSKALFTLEKIKF